MAKLNFACADTNGYGQSYAYDAAGRLTSYESASYTGYDATHKHGIEKVSSVDRYDYDQNGNMITRNKGLSTAQTLTWNAENQLASISGTGLSESYLYNPDGQRVKKVAAGASNYYINQFFEVDSTSSHIRYYYFGGQRVAMRKNSVLTYLHADHLGSPVLTSVNAASSATQTYRAYGKVRTATGSMPTRYQFTGQYLDGSGLQYYNARYYDPQLGTFISPDTMVPDATNVFDYNRYMYTRGNPLKYNDPTGHQASCTMDQAGNTQCQGDYDNTLNIDPANAPKRNPDYSGFYKTMGMVTVAAATAPLVALFGPGLVTAGAAKLCADGDCTNEVSSTPQVLRREYENGVRSLSQQAEQMRTTGKSSEEIARTLHIARRALGEQYKAMTPPDQLAQIYERNLQKYGDKLGPTIEWLRTQGKSWEEIIESASRPGGKDIVPKLLDQ